MSFMYNPFPYDDPRAVNRPALPKKTVEAVVAGTPKAAAALAGDIVSRRRPHPAGISSSDSTATPQPIGRGWSILLSQQLLGKGIELDVVAFTEACSDCP